MAKTQALCILLQLVAAAAVSGMLGCTGDLPKSTLITHMRVLGAKTTVKGDELRSTPKPGETATLTWAMAYPSVKTNDDQLSSYFISCTAPTQYTGIPTCQEFIDLLATAGSDADPTKLLSGAGMSADLSCKGHEGETNTLETISQTCVSKTPKLDVKIENNSKVAAKLILGIICRNGIPALDPKAKSISSPFRCDKNAGVKDEDAESLAVYGTIPIERVKGDANDNPDSTQLKLALAATPAALSNASTAWDETAASDLPTDDDDCASQANMDLLKTVDGEVDTIKLAFPAAMREKYSNGELETLEFSTYATAGELKRRFTVFSPEDTVVKGMLEDTTTWKLTKEEKLKVTEKGLLVRFFFTVLDRRGGFDVTTRAACVLRSAPTD